MHVALRHFAPALALGAAAVALTWPTAAQLGTAIPGEPSSDVYDHLWGYAWFHAELAAGRLPWRTDAIHWPPGGVLWFPDPVGALASVPLRWVTSAATAFSLVQLLQVGASMASGYALGLHAGRSRAAGVLAGVVFGGSPYALSLLHSGTTEYLGMAALPLVWLALDKVVVRGGGRAITAAIAAWWWAGACNFYYAAFGSLLLALAFLCAGPRSWRTTAPRLFAVAGGFGVTFLPVVAAAWTTLGDPLAIVASESAPGWNYAVLPATDILTFVTPGDYSFPDLRAAGNLGILHVNYLGWIALLLAIAGAVRSRTWRVPLLAAGLVALGPTLCVAGVLPRLGDAPIPLPAALLYVQGSPFRLVHHPYRWVVLVQLFLAAAAAAAVASRPRLAIGAGVLAAVETAAISPARWPLAMAPVEAPSWYLRGAGDATVGATWDLPPDHRRGNRRYEMMQVLHGKPIPYGVNTFLPAAFADNHFARAVLGCVDKLQLRARDRDGGPPRRRWDLAADPTRVDADRGVFQAWGYTHLVVHRADGDVDLACLELLVGPESHRDDEVVVFAVGR